MDPQEAQQLLQKYAKGECDEQEIILVESWFLKIKGDQQPNDLPEATLQADVDDVFNSLRSNYLLKERSIWPRVAAAASIILCLSFGGYFILQKSGSKLQAKNQLTDIAPGGNRATLTLANGSKIDLNNAGNGTIAKQGNAIVVKQANGKLTYNTVSKPGTTVLYNTMTTPRGGKYDLTLADGTKVWLNAASSITYPTTFTGSSREVSITGEAYFEVTKNKYLPFRVKSGPQTVEVLGTHFNINAYTDESRIRTTLLEGKVKVFYGAQSSLLNPGQQASIGSGSNINISATDVNEAIAWRNGLFQFNKADIKSVMRQLSRWYDVDIAYQGNIPDKSISGKIYRNVNASQVLQILGYLKIHHIIIQDKAVKKIIITP